LKPKECSERIQHVKLDLEAGDQDIHEGSKREPIENKNIKHALNNRKTAKKKK
jgi:hypothetical protein